MAEASSTVVDPSDHVEWMWKSNPNPWSETEPAEWKHYSDIENLIIEEAFSNGEPKAIFDRYYIDFKHEVQTLTTDKNKQKPVKRMLCKREDKHLREERFMENPVTSKHGMGDQYGWMSPFIVEVRRSLGLKIEQLPSKDESLVPMLVEKAANGIIEEGKQPETATEAEMMAKLLREKTNQGFKEVWKCCVYLYSMETFLYKKMNEIMRLVGSEEHDQIWRNKVHTLGPFCLLLWDDPINEKLKSDMTIYRGVQLAPDQIAMYEDLANHRGEYHSWQAFTSCSRNRTKAEAFGNALFVIEVDLAFVADISSLSYYQEEEEELITPGVCFCVSSVVYDAATNKHVITLQLRQRWSNRDRTKINTSQQNDDYDDHLDDARVVDRLRRRFRRFRDLLRYLRRTLASTHDGRADIDRINGLTNRFARLRLPDDPRDRRTLSAKRDSSLICRAWV